MDAEMTATEEMLVEATRLLVEVMCGSGALTPDQALRAQEFISKSCRRRGDTARHVMKAA